MTGPGILPSGSHHDTGRPFHDARQVGPWLLVAGLSLCFPAHGSNPPGVTHGLTAAIGTSDVNIAGRDDTWTSQWLQWDTGFEHGGLFARAEHRSRNVGSGNLAAFGGHWLGTHWILSGEVEAGSGASFIPQHTLQLQAGYRLDSNHVARVGYRRTRYPGATLRLWSVSGLLYRGDDEWELGVRQGELDIPRLQRIAYGLLRGQWTCTTHWTCGLRLAAGRNVFGADEPGFDSGNGWQAGTFVAYRLPAGGSLRLDLDAGRATRFRQNSLTLSYRHVFAH